jgi:hypothetical protein
MVGRKSFFMMKQHAAALLLLCIVVDLRRQNTIHILLLVILGRIWNSRRHVNVNVMEGFFVVVCSCDDSNTTWIVHVEMLCHVMLWEEYSSRPKPSLA